VSDFHVGRVRRINVGLTTEAVLRPRLPRVARQVMFTADACRKCESVLRCHRDRQCLRAAFAQEKLERRARVST
jgi:hypothetical protein